MNHPAAHIEADPNAPNPGDLLAELIAALPTTPTFHARTQPLYKVLDALAKDLVSKLFSSPDANNPPAPVGPFGTITFPYRAMGAVDTLDLFGLDELILFALYHENRGRYANVVDAGANLGLHSIILDRCGYNVRCFEPDPKHAELLRANLTLNDCARVQVHEAAVSQEDGTAEFVRVLGNTTGSHLDGAKGAPYGDLERFTVDVQAFSPLVAWADLMKIDVEGHEATILLGTRPDEWANTDAVLEVGTAENAQAIFEHFAESNVRLYAQKVGWGRVESLTDMPTSYKEGSLFLSARNHPWGHPL